MFSDGIADMSPMAQAKKTAVRRHCQYVYELAGNNKRQAARVLGIARSTLERKLAPE